MMGRKETQEGEWTRFDYDHGETIWQRPCPDCDRGLLSSPARFCRYCRGEGFLVSYVDPANLDVAETTLERALAECGRLRGKIDGFETAIRERPKRYAADRVMGAWYERLDMLIGKDGPS